MKRILTFVLCMAVLSVTSFAQAQETQSDVMTSGPKMELESKVIDYGTIKKNSERKRTISFTNAGNEPLVIANCKGSCGCTVPTCPKQPIMPGETSSIEVSYDTKRVGPINKTVTINIEGQEEPVRISVKGKVLPEEAEGDVK